MVVDASAIKPEPAERSHLDVEGIDFGIMTSEIVEFIHDGKRTAYEPMPDLD